MIATDAVPVAVAAGGDDLELVIGQLGSRGHGQGAAVQGVHAVGVEVAGQVRRAADAADGQDLVGLEPQLGDRLFQGREHAEVAAPRAPVRIDLALEILDRHLGALGLGLGLTPYGRFRVNDRHDRLPQTWISCTGT